MVSGHGWFWIRMGTRHTNVTTKQTASVRCLNLSWKSCCQRTLSFCQSMEKVRACHQTMPRGSTTSSGWDGPPMTGGLFSSLLGPPMSQKSANSYEAGMRSAPWHDAKETDWCGVLSEIGRVSPAHLFRQSHRPLDCMASLM